MNLVTARDQFIQDKLGEGKSPATLRVYKWHIAKFIEWLTAQAGRATVLQFNAARIREYLNHRAARDLAPDTLNLDSTALRQFARWGARRRYWRREDVEDVPVLTKPRHLPRPYSDAAFRALMALPLTGQDVVLRALLFFAGLRESEAIGLRLRHIHRPHGAIPGQLRVMGKGRRERVIEIPPVLWAILEDYLKTLREAPSDRTLLAKPDGTPWSPGMVQRRFRRWGKDAKVPKATAHQARHWYATNLVETGAELDAVRELLGHSSLATTQVYTKLSDRRRAAAVLRAFSAPTFRPDYARAETEAENHPETPGKT